MTDKPKNQPDRLERMLRQWGADEAGRTTVTPAMPAFDGAGLSKSRMRTVLRWAPLAAAAILLAASCVVLYVGSLPGRVREPAVVDGASKVPPATASTVPSSRPADDDRILELEKQAADLRGQIATASTRIAELTGVAADAGKLRTQLDELRKQYETGLAKWTAALDVQRKEALAEVGKQAGRIKAAELKIAELETARRVLKTAADEGDLAKEQVSDLRKRLVAAGDELTRRRKTVEAVEVKLAKANGESQRMAVRQQEIIDAFQRTYLASVAPGQSGIEARKTAIRARQMLDRLAKLSGDVRSDNTRQLLDRLEAVLTRLDLINADRAGDAQSFSRLLGQGDLQQQIDDALGAPGQAAEVKNWLFEAKLILMGEPNAG